MVARVVADGDRVHGFWSREAIKHVCVIGFIRRKLDAHKSEKSRFS